MNAEMLIMCLVIPALILLVFLLFRLILEDMKSGRRYRDAEACTGIVMEQMEDYQISAYGSGGTGTHTRTYRQYKIQYVLNGTVYYGVLRTKEKNLAPGSPVNVKYAYNERTGQPQILDPSRGDRVRELGIGAALGVILTIILIFLKSKGLM